YLRYAAQRRRAAGEETAGEAVPGTENGDVPPERLAELEGLEQYILCVSDDGFGKRTSAYEYRINRRGGKGIASMDLERGGSGASAAVVAAFPIEDGDHVMLVTDGGQLIRCPVHDVRVAGRATRGVTLFRIAEDERVVSVTRLAESEEESLAGDNGVRG